MTSGVHTAADPTQLGLPADASPKTVLAQVAAAVFGPGTIGFYAIQTVTAAILILAANTSFNGFPMLVSILARDRYAPRQFHTRGDRLVFSNGIIALAVFAILLIVAFDANTNALIQLYVLGVFLAFTLSQIGMVRHWHTQLSSTNPGSASSGTQPDTTDPARRRRIRRSQTINAVGAAATGVVLVVVLVTKFLDGAWIVVLAIPILFVLMRGVNRHYQTVADEIAVEDGVRPAGPARNHVLVLVSRVSGPTLRAVAYARLMRPDTVTALGVAVDDDETRELNAAWEAADPGVGLQVLESPYREIIRPIMKYVRDYPRPRAPRHHHRDHPRIRRRALVGTDPAQSKRSAAQSPAAVPTRRGCRRRPLAPALRRGHRPPRPAPAHLRTTSRRGRTPRHVQHRHTHRPRLAYRPGSAHRPLTRAPPVNPAPDG